MSNHVGHWDSMNTVLLVGVVVFFCAFALVARAARRLLIVDVRDGRVIAARGRAPPGLLGEIEDVVRRDRASGRFVVAIEGSSVALRPDPTMSSATAQHLRNVVGRFPLGQWRDAPRI